VNPQSYFGTAASYATDPNQQIKRGVATNYIYARCKNLSTTEDTDAYLHLYASTPSLFLNPDEWKQSKLRTYNGTNYTKADAVQPGGIGVGKEVLLLDGGIGRACLVGIATPSPGEPDIPDHFSSYSAYVNWIKNNTNICMNNLNVLNTPPSDYEALDQFSNPEPIESPALFLVSLEEAIFPTGTTIKVECEIIGFHSAFTYDGTTTRFFVPGMVPVGYSGLVRTTVTLPQGTAWPAGGMVKQKMYIGREPDDIAARHALPVEQFSIDATEKWGAQAPGLLLPVGVCGVVYRTP
jgi:hypothetical protein